MPESKPHSELHERIVACREQIEISPFSHTIAAGWYAEDVPRLLEQLETLQAEYRDFVNEISFPTFEDSRIEWVEVQIDKDVLAGARSRTASFPAKSQEDE